jgi:hypothetical protein
MTRLCFKKLLLLICLFLGFLLLVPPLEAMAQGWTECSDQGGRIGTALGKQFCDDLERAYRGKPPYKAYAMPQFLCTVAAVMECRKAMRAYVVNQRPLCRDILTKDWRGARDQWNDFQAAHCKQAARGDSENDSGNDSEE